MYFIFVDKTYILNIDSSIPILNTEFTSKVDYSYIINIYEILRYAKIKLVSELEYEVIKSKFLNRLPIDVRLKNLTLQLYSGAEIFNYNERYGRFTIVSNNRLNFYASLDILTAIDAVKLMNNSKFLNSTIYNNVSHILIKPDYSNVEDLFLERLRTLDLAKTLQKLLPKYSVRASEFGNIYITDLNLSTNKSKQKPYFESTYDESVSIDLESLEDLNAELIHVGQLSSIRRNYENL